MRRRYHNAPDNQTGPLEDPATTPKARVSYVASYPDALGRVIATADYGTNGGTALTRPATVPARSDNVLVTTTGYNSRGDAETTTDPAGMVTFMQNDDAGREIERIVNYRSGSSSSSSSSSSSGGCGPSADTNVTTRTSYTADGNVASITAVNPSTGDQVTNYTYGTTLGSGVDGAVRRLMTSYEVRGMRSKLTSYDNATIGSGSVVNEVQFAYNDFGQLIADFQSHSGAVNTGSTPKVQYGYANGSANTIRPTSLTYPNGRVISYDYGTAGGIPDASSRIDAIKDGGTALAQYSYLGLGTFVITDYTDAPHAGPLSDAHHQSETRHHYYTEPTKLQVIEERVGSSTDAERQFVWGLRYIDDLVLRDRDTDGNGSLDERLYALEDANWNVTEITNASGTAQERYSYSAYGVPIFLDATFGSIGSSSYRPLI